MNTVRDIGFIGLGHMGSALAESLIDTKLQLHVYDPLSSATEAFARLGAQVHGSPRAVADAATIVFACLPTQKASMDVACGRDGVIHGAKIRIYVETSTLGTEVIKNISASLAEHHIATLDSPITGGPARARAGTLALMVSGPAQSIEEARPTLKRLARDVYVMGDQVGMAQLMKLINNVLLGTNMIAAAEGLTLGAKAGLSPAAILQVLRNGTGASTAGCDILGQEILSGAFDFGAAVSILDKDLRAGLHEAGLLDVRMPVINQAGDVWHRASTSGRANDDFTTIIKMIQEENGV